MSFTQAATKYCEVLAVHKHWPAGNEATASDDSVSREACPVHAKVVTAVLNKHARLGEAAWVQQHCQPLPGGEFALLVLSVHSLGATSLQCCED
jgi:hypothetical protein